MAKAKIKTLLGTGLAALCSHIKQCNTAIGDLSEATANGFEETDDIPVSYTHLTLPTILLV